MLPGRKFAEVSRLQNEEGTTLLLPVVSQPRSGNLEESTFLQAAEELENAMELNKWELEENFEPFRPRKL